MKPFSSCRLYTFVDEAYLHGRNPEEIARQLCDGGSDIIQLRAKSSAPEEIERLASRIIPIVERAGVCLVINDHPETALRIGAAATHLGQQDFFGKGYSQAAQLVGHPKRLGLGLSTHAPDQAAKALAAGPDYIAIGPVFHTQTKPGRPAATLDYVRWSAANVSIPWFAIGGITLQNLDSVMEAGASRICVVSAILTAPDIVEACQAFKNRLVSASP